MFSRSLATISSSHRRHWAGPLKARAEAPSLTGLAFTSAITPQHPAEPWPAVRCDSERGNSNGTVQLREMPGCFVTIATAYLPFASVRAQLRDKGSEIIAAARSVGIKRALKERREDVAPPFEGGVQSSSLFPPPFRLWARPKKRRQSDEGDRMDCAITAFAKGGRVFVKLHLWMFPANKPAEPKTNSWSETFLRAAHVLYYTVFILKHGDQCFISSRPPPRLAEVVQSGSFSIEEGC